MRTMGKMFILVMSVWSITNSSPAHATARSGEMHDGTHEVSVAVVCGKKLSLKIPVALSESNKKLAAKTFIRKAISLIIDAQIKKYGIHISLKKIAEKSKAIAKSRIAQSGNDQASRDRLYSKVRRVNRTIAKALSIWKKNNAEGDAYAIKHMKPYSESTWQWLKDHCNDPSVEKAIRDGEHYSDASVIAESNRQARQELYREALISRVLGHDTYPKSAEGRYAKILKYRQRIQIKMMESDLYDSMLLCSSNAGESAQLGTSTSTKDMLLGPSIGRGAISKIRASMYAEAALSFEALSRGSLSRNIVVPWAGSLIVRRYKIVEIPSKLSQGAELSLGERSILKNEWRECKFGQWLLKHLRSDVEIRHNYKWLLGRSK